MGVDGCWLVYMGVDGCQWGDLLLIIVKHTITPMHSCLHVLNNLLQCET